MEERYKMTKLTTNTSGHSHSRGLPTISQDEGNRARQLEMAAQITREDRRLDFKKVDPEIILRNMGVYGD